MTHNSQHVVDATTRVMQTLIEQGRVDGVDLPDLIERVGAALGRLEATAPVAEIACADVAPASAQPAPAVAASAVAPGVSVRPGRDPQTPAVPVEESVTPDHIVCLEDGRKMKMLKRHLKNAYGMTPEQYKAKWGLPDDYPMVAPRYREARRRMATRAGGGGFTGTRKVAGQTAGQAAGQADNRAAA